MNQDLQNIPVSQLLENTFSAVEQLANKFECKDMLENFMTLEKTIPIIGNYTHLYWRIDETHRKIYYSNDVKRVATNFPDYSFVYNEIYKKDGYYLVVSDPVTEEELIYAVFAADKKVISYENQTVLKFEQ